MPRLKRTISKRQQLDTIPAVISKTTMVLVDPGEIAGAVGRWQVDLEVRMRMERKIVRRKRTRSIIARRMMKLTSII